MIPANKNMIQLRKDKAGKPYLDANDVLSNETDNLLGISPVDGKVVVREDELKKLLPEREAVDTVCVHECGDTVYVKKSAVDAYYEPWDGDPQDAGSMTTLLYMFALFGTDSIKPVEQWEDDNYVYMKVKIGCMTTTYASGEES